MDIREALEALNNRDREEVFDRFKDFFWELYQSGELAKASYYKLASHQIHLSVDRMQELIERNKEARQFIAGLLLRKAEMLKRVAQELLRS